MLQHDPGRIALPGRGGCRGFLAPREEPWQAPAQVTRRPPIAAVLALSFAWGSGPARAEEIRIEIARGKPAATLRATGATFTAGPGGSPLAAAAGVGHALSARGAELLLDGKPVPAPLVIRPAAAPLRVDGRVVAGRVEAWSEKGGLVLVNALDLEDYVAAVVASEVPSSWPAAALQAQAVAARTYAVAQKIAQGPGARAHLGASVLDQVYAGAAHLESGARKASRATAGEVLTWEAAPIAAYFSSSCGGRGESGEAAFRLPPGSTPYLPGGDDGDADAGAPRREWTVRKSLAELSALLRKANRLQAAVSGISVGATTPSGRVSRVLLRTAGGREVPMSGAELRQLVGYTALPSLWFTVAVEGGAAVFRGRGSGHGVGLCQWGARGRAVRGETYRQILAHYYPGAEIRRMY
ncbi:MAG: SpoIID/LytB domain-containing protein [Myxococcales bacterium]